MKLFKQAKKYGAKAAAGATALMLSGMAMAQETGGANAFDQFFDAVDLSGIALKVGAAGLAVIAIALTFKGPDVAKRVIRKV